MGSRSADNAEEAANIASGGSEQDTTRPSRCSRLGFAVEERACHYLGGKALFAPLRAEHRRRRGRDAGRNRDLSRYRTAVSNWSVRTIWCSQQAACYWLPD